MRGVEALHTTYPKKRFTLDGRLVGDLGEILMENHYEIKLYEGQEKHHDGETPDGKRVQIKTTMKDSLTFPADHIPDYYLGIKINKDGSFTEIFNGLGATPSESIKNRAPTKTNLHSISITALSKLNSAVKDEDRISRRSNN